MFSISSAVKRQLAAACTCSLASLTIGCMIGWPAPTLKKLRAPDSPVKLTKYEETWVVNAMYCGTIFSPFPSGFMMKRLGRKKSLLILSSFSIISWTLVYFSTSAAMLMAARLFAGFWLGSTQTVVPIYMAEISQPHVRGIFGTFYMLTSGMGNNVVFVVAPYVSIQTMAIFCGLLSALFLILFSLCPESPYGYIMRKKTLSAEKTLSWLRAGESVQAELEAMKTSVDKEVKTKSRRIKKLVTNPAYRKAFIIVELMNIMERASGSSCIKAFSSIILPHLGPLTTDHCTMIMGFFWTFSSLICTLLVDKAGRKPLLYVSSLGIIISMSWTAVWYYLNDHTNIDVSHLTWLPLLGFISYGITYSIGLGPITNVFQGEMFPNKLRGPASALTTITAALASIFSTWLFVELQGNVGMYMNFVVFAGVGLISLLVTCFYFIETKGKSLQTIQAELLGSRPERMRLMSKKKSVGSSVKYGALQEDVA